MLLTIYKLAGSMPAPELRITLVQPQAARVTSENTPANMPSESLKVTAHIERMGDVTVGGGQWAGTPGSRGAMEGFAVTPAADLGPDDIEYQAVLGSDWTTPWLPGGEFCGSRGLSLPLLGARIRLREDAAKNYSISYWGSFIGTGEVGPISDGAVCGGSGAPLEALRVVLTRRQNPATATLVNHPSSPAAQAKQRAAAAPAKPSPKAAKSEKVTTLTSIRSKLGRK